MPQQVMQKRQELQQSGQDAIKKILEKPNIEQVFHFLQDNRIRTFTLDIETDSTIMIDENAEKQRRGGVRAGAWRIAAAVTADGRRRAEDGRVLLASCSSSPPRRSALGAQLEASIDELVELMERKADQPRPDDPTTAAIKMQMEIEKMKQDRQRETDKADLQLKQQELQMRDQHEQAKIASNEKIKMAELMSRPQDDESRAN